MAWTYTDDPTNVPADAVRLEIGDTVAADPLPLTDAQVAYYLSEENNNVLRAAARCAGALAGYYARQADFSMGGLSVSASQRREHFKSMAASLIGRALDQGGASISVGGLSRSEKDVLDQDADALQPQFKIGQDDLPGNNVNDDPDYTSR